MFKAPTLYRAVMGRKIFFVTQYISQGLDCSEPGASTSTLPISPGYWRASLTSITIRGCLNEVRIEYFYNPKFATPRQRNATRAKPSGQKKLTRDSMYCSSFLQAPQLMTVACSSQL